MSLSAGADEDMSRAAASSASEFGRVLEDYFAAIEAGQAVSAESLIVRYPQFADRLRSCIPVLNLSMRATAGPEIEGVLEGSEANCLGDDFLLVGLIAWGGMGIVFEAYQISLKRRVALKVLPFAASLDPGKLGRFRIEAQAAAKLHHTNIVPIFSVGRERGVHYYAMQYIEGSTLAAMIQERRGEADRNRPTDGPGLSSDLPATEVDPRGDHPETPNSRPVAASPLLRSPANGSLRTAHFRMVAELGVQAAEALDYAHRHGVVHRDVKPSNLMVDDQGNLWITDFGLARMESDSNLTLTGDILGTLRYMSPEQSSGDHSRVDHRTDIYSLGATLYEFLTLRPAHEGCDRNELLHRLSVGEPRRPRAWDRAIPRDLETIILRALNRDANTRYQTARELADDLRRFLDGRPILARRPSPWKRAERWVRRHKPLAASLATICLLGMIGGGIILSLAAENNSLARTQAHASYINDLGQASRLVRQNHLPEAIDILARHIPAEGSEDVRSFPWHYLWRLCHVRPLVLKGHTDNVYRLNYAPDGKTLATSGRDGTIRLWDPTTGASLRTLRGHYGEVNCVTYSPSGDRLASCGHDGFIRLWDAHEDRPPVIVGRHQSTEEVIGVLFTPDGRTLISCDASGLVKFWDLATGGEARSAPALNTRINGMTISPDGRLLATATEKPGVMIAEIARPNRSEIIAGFGFSRCVAFSHDGKLIAGGRNLKQFWIAPSDGKSAPAWPLLSDSFVGIDGVAFSPDDSVLATCGGDGLVCLWNPTTGALLRSYRTGAQRLWGVTFSPDGRSLATCGTEGTVEIWDATVVQEAESTVLPFRSEDWLASNLADETFSAVIRAARVPDKIRAVTFDLGAARQTAEHSLEITDPFCLALSPDHSRLAMHRPSDKARIDLVPIVGDAGRRSVTIPPEIMPADLVAYPINLAFSSDGKVLAATVMDLGVASWEISSGRVLASIPGMPVNRLTLSPNGDRIATEIDGRLHVWDSAARSLRDYPRVSFRPMDTIVFSPDGAKVAVGYQNDAVAIAIWDVGKVPANPTLIELPEHLSGLAFSPDGKILAAGNSRGQIILIDLETQRRLITLPGLQDAVTRITFSPDGRTILAYSQSDASRPPVVTKWTGNPSHTVSLPSAQNVAK